MLVYTAKKDSFLEEVRNNQIQLVILRELKRKTGKGAAPNEITSWANSLQFMANVLRDDEIPSDAGVSIEYQLPLSSKRIDFILTGQNPEKQETAVIIELKQWSKVEATQKDAIVRTWLNGGVKETPHPSYQAWSYAALIDDFNETVRSDQIVLRPCAYLHNLVDATDVADAFYAEHIAKAPVFISTDAKKLSEFLKQHVRFGDTKDLMYRIEHGKIKPSKGLAESLSSMLAGNQEFLMIDEQKVVFETAISLAHLSQIKRQNFDKQVLIVEGGPGTGKSVVAINIIVELTKREMLAQYISKNAAPRAVYSAKLAGTMKKTRVNNLFKGSGGFYDTEPDFFDALVVDEAHRLNARSGLYRNLGENQVKELINSAKFSVFFVDEDQRVTLQDIGSKAEIKRWAAQLDATVTELTLDSQFRCNGSDAYLAWVDDVLQKRETANSLLRQSEYDFRVFDDPNELRRTIESKNQHANKARLVAGYCWDWKSKNEAKAFDISLENGFSARWNLTSDGSLWAIASESVTEVGCVHTAQGLELDYVGVIIGPDLIVRNGVVICDPSKRSKNDQSIKGYKTLVQKSSDAELQIESIIKNTYRTLLTRAQKGCYLYCTDKETANYFKSRLERVSVNQTAESKIAKKTPYPFRILPIQEVKPYINSVPVFNMKIAAGVFSTEQNIEDREWAELPDHFRMQPNLFLAQVIGESMNKVIPSGSWCLFRANPGGTRHGKIVLVELRNRYDPETQGRYTVKQYIRERIFLDSDSNGESRIELWPNSDDSTFQKITLMEEQGDDFFVVGEFLSIITTE
jgi:uncharacterized protein